MRCSAAAALSWTKPRTLWWTLWCTLSWTLVSPNWAAAGPGAAAPATANRCSWDSPGTNPYGGELAAAVDRYTDIPEPTRAALKARMASQRYDDVAVIGRDHISGTASYGPELRDMHFGNGRLCRTVTRQRWAAGAEERGLVYCEAGHCLIVPTVCRNVSRVTRRPATTQQPGSGGGGAGAGSGAGAGAGAGPAVVLVPETAELQFDAPGAGRALGSSDALPWTGPTALTLVGSGASSGAAETLAPALAPLPGAQFGAPNGGGSFAGLSDGPVWNGHENGQGSRLTNGQDAWHGGPSSGTPPQPLAAPAPWQDGGAGWLPGGPELISNPVPEPGAWVLWLLGLATLAAACRRHRRLQLPPATA